MNIRSCPNNKNYLMGLDSSCVNGGSFTLQILFGKENIIMIINIDINTLVYLPQDKVGNFYIS